MSENTRAFRKTRVGQVVSDKMDKTIVVAVVDNVKHLVVNLLRKILEHLLLVEYILAEEF